MLTVKNGAAALHARLNDDALSVDNEVVLMPDRFANGDPSNDSPPEYGRPADRKTGQTYHGGVQPLLSV